MPRLGYQIPNFNYPDVGPDRLFDVVAQRVTQPVRVKVSA